MKMSKGFAEFFERAKQNDSYWVEKIKLDFSVQLEKARKTAGMSYADIARSLGKSAAYVTKVFRGDSNLTIESMVKLSRTVGGTLNITVVEEAKKVVPAWSGCMMEWKNPAKYHVPALNSVTTAKNDEGYKQHEPVAA